MNAAQTQVESWGQADLAAVVGLLNRASEVDRFVDWNVDEAILGDPDYDPSALVCIREGGEIVGAAAGVVRPANEQRGAVGHVKLLAVDPDRRGRRLATMLLDVLEPRLVEGGAKSLRVFHDAPAFLRPGVDYRQTDMISLLQRRGYQAGRAAVNMGVDLKTAPLDTAADEARLAAAGFEVRRLKASDEPSFGEYMQETWGGNWRFEAQRSLRRDPISTHVALRNGEFVGFATHNSSGPGQFGPMGTSSTLRGQGVGAILLKRCLADQRDQGLAECDIQWVGPIGFYARHVGARVWRCFLQFEKMI